MAHNWYLNKKTFNPDTNDFDIELVTISKEETAYEVSMQKKSIRCFDLGLCLGVVFSIVSIASAATFNMLARSNPTWWWAFGISLPICVFLTFFLATRLMNKSWRLDEELHAWVKENIDYRTLPEAIEIFNYNEEQEKIAEAWRAEHPFEEHIRTCINDPSSSVAIAVAAKYYAENYLKEGVSRETVD